jgi:hypothetical protein
MQCDDKMIIPVSHWCRMVKGFQGDLPLCNQHGQGETIIQSKASRMRFCWRFLKGWWLKQMNRRGYYAYEHMNSQDSPLKHIAWQIMMQIIIAIILCKLI